MQISKLPNAYDPNVAEENYINEINGQRCPFCGAKESDEDEFGLPAILKGLYSSWFGFEDEYGLEKKHDFESDLRIFFGFIVHIFDTPHHWRVNHYSCSKCGAEWSSEPFRTDLDEDYFVKQ